MKIIKMKIQSTRTQGGTHYEYPSAYIPQKVRYGPFYESGVKERGGDYTYILFGVNDADAPQFLSANGLAKGGFTFEAVEADKTEALEFGNAHTQQSTKIMDQEKVLMICAKVASGGILTQEDKDVLDPDSPEIGINKTKSFQESLDNALARI